LQAVPAVSVIVAARDAEGLLERALDALARQDLDDDFEVVVVDNGSRDATAALAERHPVVSRVVRRPRGDGPGAARNAGVGASRGGLLAFTDADCEPAPGWLREGLRAAQGADLVQGAVRPAPEAVMGAFDRTLWRESPSGLWETANLFVRREAFERTGGFPPGLEPARGGDLDAPFGEDALFGWRAVRAGARTAFCPEALVHHAVLRRGPGGFVAEPRRRRQFPALVREIPELREGFLHRRWFLSRRSARFDLAVAGTVLALARRRPLALLALAPYAAELRRTTGDLPPGGAARVIAAGVAADAVGAAALVRGSLAARTLVL
jgi:glycosyltransferase involved in cell wall biosynthesis